METYFAPELNPNPQVEYSVIDMKKGDVTGDGVEDEVYLLGVQPSGAPGPNYFEDITVSIVDGKDKKTTYLRFKYNAGNNPKLLLDDFTGDGIKEIFVSIASSTNPGEYFYYLFSAKNHNLRSLFNFILFNEFSEYRVTFQDYYKVKITGLRSGKEFFLDLSTKDPSYLSNFYNPNGTLIRPIMGDALPLGNLFPVDLNDDNVLELLAFQRVVGDSLTDVLGYIQTYLYYDGHTFVPGLILLAVPGKDIPTLPSTPSPTPASNV